MPLKIRFEDKTNGGQSAEIDADTDFASDAHLQLDIGPFKGWYTVKSRHCEVFRESTPTVVLQIEPHPKPGSGLAFFLPK